MRRLLLASCKLLIILSCFVNVGQATTWFVSTTGSDAHGCTNSGADVCLTFNRGLTVATAGDTISVAAGTYSAQTLTQTKSNSPRTIIQCASATADACTVTLDISTSGGGYNLVNITVDTGSTHGGHGYGNSGNNITLTNFHAHGSYVSMFVNGGSTNFLWDGGEFSSAGATPGARSCVNGDSEPITVQSTSPTATVNGVTIRNIDFWKDARDPTTCAGDPMHVEYIRIDGDVRNYTLEKSWFHTGSDNNTGTLFITSFLGGPPSNITIQNNFFSDDTNNNIVMNGTSGNNACSATIAYNTLYNGISLNGCDGTGMSIIGNAGWWQNIAPCPGTTHVKNVWQWSSSFSCGTDTVVIGTAFQLGALGLGGTENFFPQTGSALINAAETAGYCTGTLGAVDHDSNVRPFGPACDAGAIEFGSSGAPPPSSSPSILSGSTSLRGGTIVR